MEEKRSVGVTVFSILYLFFATLLLKDAAIRLMGIIRSIVNIFHPTTDAYGGGFGLFLFMLAGSITNLIPCLTFTMIGIGLFRLSNKIRLIMLFASPVFIYFIISFLYATTKPYKALHPSLFFMSAMVFALLTFLSSLFFFTRPKVKEQFK